MKMRYFRSLSGTALTTVLLFAGASALAQPTEPTPASAHQPSISRGHYLAIAADCAACHTNGRDGQFLAGGYAISSPMGNIYSTNITPSKTHGIGNYTLEQFSQALRHGIRADGAQLYPAMPYDAYNRLTDEDVKSLYAYIMNEVKPVDAPSPKTQLPFPFSIRASLGIWKIAARIEGKPYVFDHTHNDDWNRGRYLVDELAHCGECHTPRNFLLAPNQSAYLAGADIGSWRAPNITNDPQSGIGGWSDHDLYQYLKTGRTAHARAAGPMAEAVEHSLQYLPDGDISAIVTYLRSVPPKAEASQTVANFAHLGRPSSYSVADANARRNNSTLSKTTDGAALYEAVCASCHQSDGKGSADGYYPSLVGNTTTGQRNPNDLIASILYGVDRTTDDHEILMPAFGPGTLVQPLNDEQIATIADYVLSHFGNAQATVSADAVKQVRVGGKQVPLAKLASPGVMILLGAGGVLGAIIVVGGVWWLISRRKQRVA